MAESSRFPRNISPSRSIGSDYPKRFFSQPQKVDCVTSGDYDYLSTWLRIPNIPLLISHFNIHVSWNVM